MPRYLIERTLPDGFARLRTQRRTAWRTSMTTALGLLLLSAAVTIPMPADAQLLRAPAAPVLPRHPRLASQAPIQTIVDLTWDDNVCRGDTPTTGVGQTLEVLFVSCGITTERVNDLLGASAVVLRGDDQIAGHFLGSASHPTGLFYFISQPILLTIPPGHFVRFTAQSLGGPILSATCSMAAKD